MPSTTANMAVVAPKANAMVATTATVNVGALASVRNENRRSRSTVSNMPISFGVRS